MSTTSTLPAWVPAFIRVNSGGPTYDIDCTLCGIGMKCGPTFGPIQGADMAATFVAQHAVHGRRNEPIGLTPNGNASKALRDYLRAVEEATA